MAENYNLNSQFGLNVSTNGLNKDGSTVNIEANETKIEKLFNAVTGYVQKYENVLSGDVEKEINMYERQAMLVGMNLRAANVNKSFDMNI